MLHVHYIKMFLECATIFTRVIITVIEMIASVFETNGNRKTFLENGFKQPKLNCGYVCIFANLFATGHEFYSCRPSSIDLMH